jgi:hypothetical protein
MPEDGQYTRHISDEERAFIEKHKDDLTDLRARPPMPDAPTAYDSLVGVIHDWPDTGHTPIASAQMLADDVFDWLRDLSLDELANVLTRAGYDVEDYPRRSPTEAGYLDVAAKEPS